MTVTTEAPSPPESRDANALFPEARRRRRRIRRVVGAGVLAVAIVAAGLVYGIDHGGAAPTPSPAPATSAPSQVPAAKILRATLAAGSAHEAWTSITSYPGCSPPISGVGVLDLAHASSSVTLSSPGCRSANGYSGRGSWRTIQIGTSVYETRRPQETWRFGKTWLATTQTEMGLVSANPLSILKAVSGPFMRVGASDIRGTATAEYVDSASLASAEAAAGTANFGPIGTPQPPLKQIPIVVDVWIDPHHRVRQISSWEPYYTQNYTDGSSQGGAYIVPATPATPDAPPRQQGFVQTTLDLWQFGTPAHIEPPPAGSVATPR